jgi:hypothetical protein
VVWPEARRAPGAALSEPIFRREGDRFVPTGHARGPWDPGAQHGGAPAALLAEAIARTPPGEEMLVARLTYDFLGPVGFVPLRVTTQVVRPGRRFQVVEAELSAGDTPVVRVRAVRLRRGDVALSSGPDAEAVPGGGPDEAADGSFPAPAEAEPEGFHRTGMEIRFGGGTSYGVGPGLAWFRLARPVVDADPPTPLARVAAAADFGNGVSRLFDFREVLFVNTDLTIHLHREPAGEWVMLDAHTRVEPHGSGLAASTLYDEHGRLGLAAQSLFVERRY